MSTVDTAHRRPRWLRATRWQLRLLLPHFLTIWSAGALCIVVALAVLAQFVDLTVSAMGSAIHPLVWWPFGIAIVMTSTYLPVHLAHGMTRATCIRAALAACLVISALNTALTMAALLVERAVYDRMGWRADLSAGNVTGTLQDGELAFAAGLALVFTSAMFSGLIVGVVYYRIGGWWGTLALPLTLLPILAASALILTADQWRPLGPTLSDGAPAREVLAVALLMASAAGFALLVRRLPVRSRRS